MEKRNVDSPRLTAELLLAGAMDCPRIQLYSDFEKIVPQDILDTFRGFIQRRAEKREPLQYILGNTNFIGLNIKVTPAVLIPRPETEELTSWGIDLLRKPVQGSVSKVQSQDEDSCAEENSNEPEEPKVQEQPAEIINPFVADICTGSGCMGLAIAKHIPTSRVWVTDNSSEALGLVRENISLVEQEQNSPEEDAIFSDRVTCCDGDLLNALPDEMKESFDLIVSNPPYIDPSIIDTLEPEVKDHEPKDALFADENGLAIIKRLCADVHTWLKSGGWFGMEFGINQAGDVKKLLEATCKYQSIEIKKDFAGIDRLALAQKI